MWPFLDLIFSKKPVAQILTPDGSWEFVPINKTIGRYFWHDKYGVFRIDPRRFKPIKNGGNTSRIALYDASSGNPLEADFLQELAGYAKRNNFLTITKDNILKTKEKAVGIQPTQKEMMENLMNKHSIIPNEPLQPNAELWLTEFKNYKPAEIGTIFQKIISLEKKYNMLKNSALKPTFQWGLIFGVILIAIIVFAAAPSILGNWQNFFPTHGGAPTPNLPTPSGSSPAPSGGSTGNPLADLINKGLGIAHFVLGLFI